MAEFWVIARGGERDGEVQGVDEDAKVGTTWWYPWKDTLGTSGPRVAYLVTDEVVTLPSGDRARVIEYDERRTRG